MNRLRLSSFTLVLFTLTTDGSPPEDRLLKDLFRGYIVEERPVFDSNEPVVVKLGVILQQIVDLNEREEQLTVNMWLKFHWKDVNLQWDQREYGNVTDLRYPAGSVWQPDVLCYNSVDSEFDSTYKVNLVGTSDGTITWIPPGIFTVSCKLDIYYWPWDEQLCFFKFGSWSFSGKQIDLQPGDFDLSEYMENGEWLIVGHSVNRSEKYYECCPGDPYQDIKFFLRIRRRTMYYIFNLIMPCILTMVLVVLGFTLSPEACEKVSLQISVSLAIIIFMTIASEMTPRTSEAVPLLGLFFQSCMVISVLATAFTVYVQNVHFRTKNHQPMSFWMRYILLELAPYVLRIHQPMRENTLKTLRNSLHGHRHSKCDTGIRTNLSFDNDKAVATARFDVTCKPCLQAFVDYLRRSNVNGDAEVADQLSELERIYSQVKMIRQSNDDSREEDRIKKEFHFAAIVVDRLGLMLFTLIMLSTAAAIVLKAPYLIA